MVNINIKPSPILSTQPKEVEKTPDGRIIYETKYPETGQTIKFSIPEENQDKFEKLVQEIHTKYGKYNINPEKKFSQAAHLATLGGAIIGGALTASLIKTKSRVGKFAKTIGGAFAGVIIGSIALTGAILHPILKYSKALKNLGYKPITTPSPMIKENQEVKPKPKEEDVQEKTKVKEEVPKDEKEEKIEQQPKIEKQ